VHRDTTTELIVACSSWCQQATLHHERYCATAAETAAATRMKRMRRHQRQRQIRQTRQRQFQHCLCLH